MARDEQNWKDEALDPETGGGKPALKPETIRPHTTAVLVVEDVDRITLDDPDSADGKRDAIKLTLEEFPDHAYWLNKSGTRTLIEKLGAVPRKWIGKRVPLVVVRVNNPRTKQSQPSLQVAPAGEWADMFIEYDGRPSSRVTRQAAKRGRPAKRRK